MTHYFMTHYWNRLVETVPIMGHKICYYGEIRKVIAKLSQLPFLPGALSLDHVDFDRKSFPDSV